MSNHDRVPGLLVVLVMGLYPAMESLALEPPGVLPIEPVGETATSVSQGACCDNETGACTHETESTCEAGGNLFQGIGTFCRACRGLFQPCLTDDDCSHICVGGPSAGDTCVEDGDCGEGGTCEVDVGACEYMPPACQLSACCNPADGACDTVLGGLCEDDTTPCISDDDCAGIGGGTCNARCDLAYGPGWISQGFGTSCDPNCCGQPTVTGGDTCDAATVHAISVPPIGDPPVSITITGDNSLATFDDFVGDGSGTCEADTLDPLGTVQDRGWWEAFALDACAYVRVDYCCTESLAGEAKQPQWAFLRDRCDPCGLPVDPSIRLAPIGDGLAPDGVGNPFCDGDDAWQTYGPLPPGTYYHNVYTGPYGTVGPYQMHITAIACHEAACCLPEQMCVGAVTERLLVDGLGEPISCVTDGDCPAGGVCSWCGTANELDCTAAGGFWKGFGPAPGDAPIHLTCAADPCEIGACCFGPGDCADNAIPLGSCDPNDPATCMSRTQCDNIEGIFQAGRRCDISAPPCPTCFVQGADNCQYPPNLWTDMSDLAMPPNGAVSADDFIPGGDTVETVCVWGVYTDYKNAADNPAYDCRLDYGPDVFRVRIYADGGGLPGTLIGERLVIGANVTRHAEPGTSIEDWYRIETTECTLVLDPPITGLAPLRRYWLEVANGADRADVASRTSGNSCVWGWAQHLSPTGRDEFAARGTDDRSIDGAPPVPGSGYVPGSGHHVDRAFCLGISQTDPLPFAPGPEELGACFDCETEVCSSQTQVDCIASAGEWGQDDPMCMQPFAGPAGDNCAVAEGGPVVISEDGLFAIDTTCSTTDGPPRVSDAQARGEFGRDLWLEYVVTTSGLLVASMCPTGSGAYRENGYDGWIALYHDRLGDPTTCLCPEDADMVVDAGDDNCTGISTMASGFVEQLVFPGECYLIRVGGWDSSFGRGLLDLATFPAPCRTAQPPVLETIADGSGGKGVVAKNRFLSFSNENNAGRTQAIRVTFVDLPSPYDVWNGAQLWLGDPAEKTENSAFKDPIPGFPNFLASPLVCDLTEDRYKDWSSFGTIHVYHEGILPGGTYAIQALEEACNPDLETGYSSAAWVTNPRWGDTVGRFDVGLGLWTAPNGSVDVAADVVAGLDKFRNVPTATSKTRTDLEPAWPDFAVAITDITIVLDAFSGAGYPFAPNSADPCP